MRGALDVHRELLGRDVPHEIVRLRRTVASADEVPDALGLPARVCVAVRVYVVTGPGAEPPRLVAALVGVDGLPDVTTLLAATGATVVRLARPDEVNAGTDFSAALVSPVCLPPDVVVLADAALSETDVVYAATGEGGTVLGIRTRDLLLATGAQVTRLTRPAAEVRDPADLAPVTGPL